MNISKKRLVDKNITSLLIAGDDSAVKPPKDYDLIYTFVNTRSVNKNETALHIWRPFTQDGTYVALGNVITTSNYDLEDNNKPSTDLIWCVKQELIDILETIDVELEPFWTNENKNLEGDDTLSISVYNNDKYNLFKSKTEDEDDSINLNFYTLKETLNECVAFNPSKHEVDTDYGEPCKGCKSFK